MTKVLFVNHKIENCGVYQFGKRVAKLASTSSKLDCSYAEVDCLADLEVAIFIHRPDVTVYNWHIGTMGWLSSSDIRKLDGGKRFFIYHQENMIFDYDKYLFFGDYDPTNSLPDEKKALISRPLFKYPGKYRNNSTLNIGSFGFGFHNKGFDKIVRLVNEEFTNAIVNLHMPPSHFGDPSGTQTREVIKKCREAHTNSSIVLNITQDFKTDEEVLSFLAGNDVNVFMYEENGDGISSVLDYALSVKRPIAITDSRMFRHLDGIEGISLTTNSLQNIIDNGTSPLRGLYRKWSRKKFVSEMEEAINE